MAEEMRSHRLTLNDRKKLTMTGVTEVISFDETAVVLQTEFGALVIQGQGLQLKALSPEGGQMAVEGTVTALSYQETRQRSGWARRLFG